MNVKRLRRHTCVVLLTALVVATTPVNPSPAAGKPETQHFLFRKILTQALEVNGTRLQVGLVEATYSPLAHQRIESRDCPAMVYIAEGEIRVETDGQPGQAKTYAAGYAFYEGLGQRGGPLIYRNVSGIRPARMLTMSICNQEYSSQAILAPALSYVKSRGVEKQLRAAKGIAESP